LQGTAKLVARLRDDGDIGVPSDSFDGLSGKLAQHIATGCSDCAIFSARSWSSSRGFNIAIQ
jgi:hypothetical protein